MSSLVPLLRQSVAEVSPIATVFRASVGADILRQGTSRARFNSLVMLVFSLVGLILAVTGIYGVTAFSVGRRTREFGLRMALGAQPREVRRLVLRGATSVAGWGLVFGTLLSLLGTRLISELFYGVPDFDVATYRVCCAVRRRNDCRVRAGPESHSYSSRDSPQRRVRRGTLPKARLRFGEYYARRIADPR